MTGGAFVCRLIITAAIECMLRRRYWSACADLTEFKSTPRPPLIPKQDHEREPQPTLGLPRVLQGAVFHVRPLERAKSAAPMGFWFAISASRKSSGVFSSSRQQQIARTISLNRSFPTVFPRSAATPAGATYQDNCGMDGNGEAVGTVQSRWMPSQQSERTGSAGRIDPRWLARRKLKRVAH